MPTLVARFCQQTNHRKSIQGFRMQRYPRKIFKPKKHKKVLLWQHLLPVDGKKLISSNLCRRMENKELIKIFVSLLELEKKEKSVAMATLVASF